MGEPGHLVCHVCGFSPGPEQAAPEICPNDGWVLVPRTEHERAPTDAFLGRTISDKYQVVGIIGRGGMGAVYRALQQPVRRPVALKVIHSSSGDQEQVQARFAKEAQVISQLRHPNTITLHDFGVHEGGTLYMVMELLEGRALSDDLERGPLPPRKAALVVSEALDALVEAHGLGLVHRDLKPDNIMLVPTTWGTERVHVLDFGIAKVLGGNESASQQLTRTGMVFGTPRYMAPEQATGGTITPATDVYALGCVLYECLAGRPPFEADQVLELMLAHRDQPPPPFPAELGIPRVLQDVAMRALEKLPEQRFPSARAMATALRASVGLAGGEEITIDEVHSLELADTQHVPTAERTPHPPGGTSQEMAGEVLRPGGRGHGRRNVVVAAAAATGQLGAGRGGEEAGPPAPARVVAPQPGADELEAAGLRLKGEGRHAEAIDKLTAALAQDPARTALHYQVAACQARLGRPDGASQALAAYLGGGADPDALGRRLAEDPDFGRVLREEAFSSWLADRGVRVAPAAPAGEAKEAGDEGRDRPRKAAKAREGERKGKKARKAKGKGRKAGPAPKPAPRPAPKPEFEMPTF